MKIKNINTIEGDYFNTPALSQSFLKAFSISPAHAFVERESKALTDGKLFHELILEPQVFDANYAITDLNLARKEGMAFKRENEGKKIVKEKDFCRFVKMKSNFVNMDFFFPNACLTMGEIVEKGVVEQGYLADCVTDAGDEVSIRIKPDLTFEHEGVLYCFDPKTVSTANLGHFYSDIKKYKYSWQDALYSWILGEVTSLPVRFIFVLCEKSAPYGVRFVELEYSRNHLQDIFDVTNEYLDWFKGGADKGLCYGPGVNKITI